ncbi:hypothetical protein D3C73_1355080 [compost metagenome]
MLGPAHRAGPGDAINNLVWFDKRVRRQIIHRDQVVSAQQRFHQTPVLRHEHSLVLGDPFLLPVFSESEHHKQLRTAVKLHVLAGVRHVVDIIIRHLYAGSTQHALPQRMTQPFGGS